MFQSLLSIHWKAIRTPLLLSLVLGFTVPLLSVQRRFWSITDAADAANMLSTMRGWAVVYPVLAAAVGLLVAVTAWSRDHRGHHVYARILPIPRWHYVLLRYGSGLTLLTLPVAAVAAGAMLAAWTTVEPAGLTAYPLALGFRFALAAAVAFSIFFAISAGTARTAGVILGVLLTLVVTQTFVAAVGTDLDLLSPVMNSLIEWPGPFEVFSGRWMLIDV